MIGITISQRFDWSSEDGNCHISFDVTRMLADIVSGKLRYDAVTSPIDSNFVRNWIIKRNLRMRNIRALTKEQLNEPVLGVWMPKGSVLLIDGSHRYLARWLKRLPTIDYRVVAFADWQPYATIIGDISCE